MTEDVIHGYEVRDLTLIEVGILLMGMGCVVIVCLILWPFAKLWGYRAIRDD